jgi:hypothetical protein
MAGWKAQPDAFGYDGFISKAEFGFHESFVDPDNGEPRAVLLLTVMTDMEVDDPTRTEILTLGKDWEPSADGRTVTHPTREGFSPQSNVMKFIERIVEIEGVLAVLEQRDGDEMDAANYEGLEFRWESEPIFEADGVTPKTYEAKDGQQRQSTRMVPVALIGEQTNGSEAKPAKKAPAKKAPAKKAAAKVEEPEVEADEWTLDGEINEKLVKMAKASDSHEEFVDMAMTKYEDEAAADPKLEQYILAPANWTLHIGV